MGLYCVTWDYTASHDNYTVSHDNYTVSHDNYTVSHDNYTVSHDNYTASHGTILRHMIIVTAENFWEYYEKGKIEEQVRICDGMLFTTLLEHLKELSRRGEITSLSTCYYDVEPGSNAAYGTAALQKVSVTNTILYTN